AGFVDGPVYHLLQRVPDGGIRVVAAAPGHMSRTVGRDPVCRTSSSYRALLSSPGAPSTATRTASSRLVPMLRSPNRGVVVMSVLAPRALSSSTSAAVVVLVRMVLPCNEAGAYFLMKCQSPAMTSAQW